ncbi:MAG: hypothetical protein COZ80_02940 [Ignavibacteria bacterium CG_4_8_14_3_um_filter_37_9]|nr:DUF302 domain-containing protein [Ignavibacteria bacterium]OIO23849.1 MAG: hypothetical protein AUJ54_00720 [Ignavibacteria bacterium CG1_02_37_35]PIP78637.1 MAG: hypothetical protein COW85_03560 [Ignavibacteria bacterium CG22_combo_CG10-13_8_21_14_all_37_15]PIS45616.1 MAG: hypothetical protein COT22_04260 [Ignavibacteria bacterium CG08_land_8_20_14_0_20_37_9]PIW99911.1 MAG: hypothetical protein COZ80_02940 [Ignavibacteria bacterium CG_4_8_14_3_um_filter_37_9]PIX93504.1 MAG: hypothetical pr
MPYYHSKAVDLSFEKAIERVTEELNKEGFGVLTEIDVKATLKKKLDVDFRNYKILGACNPPFAYKALQAEDNIGVLLPCNFIVQEKAEGGVQISAVNPLESMKAVENENLKAIAGEVAERILKVLGKV